MIKFNCSNFFLRNQMTKIAHLTDKHHNSRNIQEYQFIFCFLSSKIASFSVSFVYIIFFLLSFSKYHLAINFFFQNNKTNQVNLC